MAARRKVVVGISTRLGSSRLINHSCRMNYPISEYQRSPDESADEHSFGGTPDQSTSEVDDDSPLCLQAGEGIFPIYELTSQHFAIASQARENLEQLLQSRGAETPPRTSEMISGKLFTENGEVLISVNFKLSRVVGPLLYCDFCQMPPDEQRNLKDLVAMLVNDWEGEQEVENSHEAHSDRPPSVVFGEEALELGDQRAERPSNRSQMPIPELVSAASQGDSKRVLIGPRIKWSLTAFAALTFAAVLLCGVILFRRLNTVPLTEASDLSRQDSANTFEPLAEMETDGNVLDSDRVLSHIRSQQSKPQQTSFRGTVVFQTHLLRSPIAGRVLEILVGVGEQIDAGETIAKISGSSSSLELRRLESELKLARAELQAAEVQLAEANKRLALGKQQLNDDLLELLDRMEGVEEQRELASLQWQRIKPLAENDNIGRLKVEEAKQALASANNVHGSLKGAIEKRQRILSSPDLDHIIAQKLDISIPTLEADVSLSRARVAYLEEQFELEDIEEKPRFVQSDFRAIVRKILIAPDDLLSSGQAVFELQDIDTRIVRLPISRAIAENVEVGDVVTLRLVDSAASFSATIFQIQAGPEPETNSQVKNTGTIVADGNFADRALGEGVVLYLALNQELNTLPIGTMLVFEPADTP